MPTFIVGAFLVLHGLVHLLYFGQSRRFFQLQPGLTWPEGSWAVSPLLGNDATRVLASALCVLAAVGLAAGGAGIVVRQTWWRPLVVGSAALSIFIYILFWDGGMHKLDQQGGVGILINAAILVAVLAVGWPDV